MARKYRMKTHKAAAKRFKVTGKGRLVRLRSSRSHRRRNKAKRVIRSFDRFVAVHKGEAKRLRRLLPHGLD